MMSNDSAHNQYAFIGSDVIIGTDVKTEPHAVIGDRCIINDGAIIGANSTLLPGIRIGKNALVTAGAVVTTNVPPNAIVSGNPARITGYTGTEKYTEKSAIIGASDNKIQPLGIGKAALYRMNKFVDLRGALTVGEFANDLPFAPQRYFMTYDVASKEVRGEHAHKKCDQFLIAVSGVLSIVLHDGQKSVEVELNKKEAGLYLPAGIWGIQYKFSPDACLLVFASRPYEPEDYIRNWDEYLEFVK